MEAVRVAFKVNSWTHSKDLQIYKAAFFHQTTLGTVIHCQISALAWSWRHLLHKILPEGANLLRQKCSTVEQIHEHTFINKKLLFSHLFSCFPHSKLKYPKTIHSIPGATWRQLQDQKALLKLTHLLLWNYKDLSSYLLRYWTNLFCRWCIYKISLLSGFSANEYNMHNSTGFPN